MSKLIKRFLIIFLLQWVCVYADEMPVIQLTARDGHWIPDIVAVPANTKFKLTIKNDGPGPEEFESHELHKEKVLGEGVQSFLIFRPLAPGEYPFFGEFHIETAQGKIVAK